MTRSILLALAGACVLLAASASGGASAQPAPAPEDAARAYLRASASALGFDPTLVDLQLIEVQHSPTGAHVRFQQTLRGIPVDGATVTVHLSPDGTPLGLTNDYARNAKARGNTSVARVRRADAHDGSRRAVGARAFDRGAPRSSLVYTRDGDRLRLTWRTRFRSSQPFGDWQVDTDASTGAALATRDLRLDDAGTVFDVNPASPGPAPAQSCTASNAASFSSLQVSRTLQGIVSGQGYLKGSYVDLTAPGITGATSGIAAGQAFSLAHTYNYTCDQAAFNEVMAYYHVDYAQRYLQSLGFSGASVIHGSAIPVHANYYTSCNAYYTPLDGGLHFGANTPAGCSNRDAAEDGDVIVHEYGHAILDAIAPQIIAYPFIDSKGVAEGQAVHEGFADLLAAAAHRDTCMGEWFNGPQAAGVCGRNLNSAIVYSGWVGEEHTDGQIWSGAMRDILVAYGSSTVAWDLVMNLAVNSAYFYDGSATFTETANAMMYVDRLLYGGTHVGVIATAFTGRGVTVDTSAPAVNTFTVPAATNSTSVTVTINGTDSGGSGLKAYCAKEQSTAPAVNDSCFVATTSVPATLTGADGTKTLYAFARDGAGNMNAGVSRSIVLDRVAPTAALALPAATNSTTPGITVTGTDPGGSGINGYCVKTAPAIPLASDTCFVGSQPATATITGPDGTKTLHAWTRDAAGNVSTGTSSDLLLDTTKPTVAFDITPAATNGSSVAVTMSGTDTGGSGINGYCVQESPSTPTAGDACFLGIAPTSATISAASDGTKTLYGFTRDSAGNVSLGASDTVVKDTVAPTVTFGITPTVTNSLTVAVTFSATDTGGSGVDAYCLRTAAGTPETTDACFVALAPTQGTLVGADGTRRLFAFARDVVGNVSSAGTDTVLLDRVAPTASLAINTASPTSDPLVSVTLTGNPGTGSALAGYMVTETAAQPGAGDAGWAAAAPTSFQVSDGDGVKTLRGWVKDLAGNVSAAAEATITLDAGPPTLTFGIQELATNGTATLTFDSVDVDINGYMVTETPTPPSPGAVAWAAAPPASFVLTGADGVRTLYGWARDAANNVSAASSDTVILDTTPPTASLAIVPTHTNTTNVAVQVTAADPGGSGVDAYCVRGTSTAPGASDGCFAAAAPTTAVLVGGDGTSTLFTFARDGAGNVSAAASDTTVLDRGTPTATLDIVPATTPVLSVAITLTGNDAPSGVNGYFVSAASTPPAANAPGWLAQPPTTFTLAGADGTKTLFGWTRDAAGNISATASDTVVLDTVIETLDVTPPAAKLTAPKVTRTTSIAIHVTGTDAVGVTGYFVSAGSAAPTVATPGWVATPPAKFTLVGADGLKTVRAWARDQAGNVSATASVVVRLDRKTPVSRIKLPSARTVTVLQKFTGTATDTGGSGVKTVYASLRRELNATTCTHWNGKKWVQRACNRPIWIAAKGTGAWSLELPKQTAAGAYVLQVAGLDVAGNRQTAFVSGVNLRKYTIPAKGTAPAGLR